MIIIFNPSLVNHLPKYCFTICIPIVKKLSGLFYPSFLTNGLFTLLTEQHHTTTIKKHQDKTITRLHRHNTTITLAHIDEHNVSVTYL
jgi:hypothetical protein